MFATERRFFFLSFLLFIAISGNHVALAHRRDLGTFDDHPNKKFRSIGSFLLSGVTGTALVASFFVYFSTDRCGGTMTLYASERRYIGLQKESTADALNSLVRKNMK